MTMTDLKVAGTAEYVSGMDERAFAQVLAHGEPDVLVSKREEAFHDYLSLPLPTRIDEEWRRTDPALFPLDRVRRLPTLQPLKDIPSGPWDEAFDVVVTVRADGYAIRNVTSEAAQKRVTVLPLAEAAEQMPDMVSSYLQGKALPAKSGKFESFNDAFWNFGLFVHIPDGVTWERGALIRYDISAADALLIPRLVVVAGRNSRSMLVEHLVSADTVCFMAVPERELYVEEGADFKLISLQEWGSQSFQISNDWGLVQRDARLNWITLNFGAARSKMKFGSDVAGPGSAADMDGIFFASGDQHMDQRTLQIHSSPDTYSRLLYKGAVKDTGRSVYQGLIIARPGAIRVDAYQTNNNLVLNEGARADSIPGLLIDADDLKCSHGSTTGNLDPEQLFYLQTRGLSEETARKALIMGFFEEVVDRIPQDFIRAVVHRNIERKMGEQDHG